MIRELFLQEHKKLWKKKSVRISFLLCVLYIVVFGSFLTYQWFTFGSSGGVYSGFGNNFDGYENIMKMKEYAKQWEGKLTEETLQEMVRDYQSLLHEAQAAHSAGDIEREKQYAVQAQRTDHSMIHGWISMLYTELEDSSQTYPSLLERYVNPAKLTGFYERRQQKVEEFLDIFGHTEEEKEYLLRMNDKVEEPFEYHWLEGWRMYLTEMLNDFGMVMAIFIVIALSTVFAGEWHNGTGMLMLTTKNGWREVAYAKVLSGIVFTLELFFTVAAGAIAGQLIYLGTEGWDMPIQYIKLSAVAPMNMLQAEIYEYAYFLLGAVGLALLVMFFSAVVRNNFIALISGLAIVYLPMALAGYMPMWVQRVFDLIPLVGSPSDIFRTNVFHLFGQIIWSPYLLVTVPVLLGGAFVPFTIRRWARGMRR
ncbi:MAG: ABC transporter permease [Lachnospiraceae bacterium]|nr:ABC transporter permease [Lachnospiraceae bacterium]